MEEILMNDKPVISQKSPNPIEVKEGKSYYWFQCGQSKKQPFCDSSHKDTSFRPVLYKATKTKKIYFCGCKYTSNQPLCDGTHSKIVK